MDLSTLPHAKATILLRRVSQSEDIVAVRLAGERAHRTLVGFMEASPAVKEQARMAGIAWTIDECDRLIELCRVGRKKQSHLKYHLRRGDPVRIRCDKQIAAHWYGPGAEEKI